MNEHKTYPFELTPLPYAYDALEPYIDAGTMHFHHDKYLKTYVDNLNNALKDYPQYHSWTLERLLRELGSLPAEIRGAVRVTVPAVFLFENFEMRPVISLVRYRDQEGK